MSFHLGLAWIAGASFPLDERAFGSGLLTRGSHSNGISCGLALAVDATSSLTGFAANGFRPSNCAVSHLCICILWLAAALWVLCRFFAKARTLTDFGTLSPPVHRCSDTLASLLQYRKLLKMLRPQQLHLGPWDYNLWTRHRRFSSLRHTENSPRAAGCHLMFQDSMSFGIHPKYPKVQFCMLFQSPSITYISD